MAKRTFSWMNPKLIVRNTKKYGKGVFAKQDIKKDEILAIFGGYVMSLKEFDKLPVKVRHYPSQILEEFVFGIKKSKEFEDVWCFNHSCDPNAGYKGQIFLVAMRKIKTGEEVTFDYAMELHRSKTKAPKGKDSFEDTECNCGAVKCRNIITDNDWKKPELQRKYSGYFQWYIQEKIDKHNKKIK